jgi:hypothetical protein
MARFASQIPNGEAVQQLEVLVRTAIFKPASELVGLLLQQAADCIDTRYTPKPGEQFKGRQSLEVQCIFGTFIIDRAYYYHPGRRTGHFPADAALGLEGAYTPALARLLCLEGADEPGFEKAELHLAETGGIRVSARQIQRVVQRVGADAQVWQERQGLLGTTDAPILYVSGDGTGVPMRPEVLAGKRGKQPDGSAKTAQVYLGCVFTQHRRDPQGHPVRDYESTTYVSSMGAIDQFGPLLRQEALRRGMGSAKQVVLLIDGAVGLGHMGLKCFKGAIQIVDFFHAMEHAGVVLDALIGKEHPDYKKRLRQWARRLLRDEVGRLIAESQQEALGQPNESAVQSALGYFENNVERMQYGTFRRQGFFIGSGVVEAGCKTIVGTRCKQSGMRWSRPGAQNILALRCIHASRHTSDFWKQRLNNHASRNDPLTLPSN